jgi:hypothetical protein
VKAKSKHGMAESLRRDLAVQRLGIAQTEIARHPAIAFDLLVFSVASWMLDERPAGFAPLVEFKRPRMHGQARAAAGHALEAIAQSLPSGWRKPASEAARFEEFRSLPREAKFQVLSCCLAATLQPKLGPAEGDEATAYDAALALTEASVAACWRPAKDNFLSRISRDQLLAIGRDALGEQWAQARTSDKKKTLVEQLDRAFADPAKYGRTPEQVEKLKTWLPTGMAFGVSQAPAKARKARKAA